MSFFTPYLRWRHSKGFGVHSPYAFSLVNDVVRPGIYHFYSYLEIDNHLKGKERHDGRLFNLIKFTLRLMIFLKSKRLVTPKKTRLAEISSKSLKIPWVVADEKNFRFLPGDIFLIEKPECDIHLIKEAIEKKNSGVCPLSGK